MRGCGFDDPQCEEDQRRLAFCEDVEDKEESSEDGFVKKNSCLDLEYSIFVSGRLFGRDNLEKFLWKPDRALTKTGICVSRKLRSFKLS